MFKDNSKYAKEAIRQAKLKWLTVAAMMVEAQAVLFVAVDTSRLKMSIDHVVDESEMVAYVGTNVEYAVYVEFGTGELAENGMGRKGGWFYKDPSGEWFFTWGQDPQPYLRPAFRKTKMKCQDLLAQYLGEMT